jgi:hypothetical protein
VGSRQHSNDDIYIKPYVGVGGTLTLNDASGVPKIGIDASRGIWFPDGSIQTTAYPLASNGTVTLSAPTNSQILYLNGNTQTNYPIANNGLGFAGNFSAGMSEVDIWNTTLPTAWPGDIDSGIRFLQLTGTSSYRDLMFLKNDGHVGIGTTTPAYALDVSGNIHSSAAVIYPDGTQQVTAWTGVLCGGDYAEAVDVSGDRKHYGPGDVLVLGTGSDSDVEKSAEPYSTMVAGIYATKPGVVGRRETLAKGAQEIPMAMVGKGQCRKWPKR